MADSFYDPSLRNPSDKDKHVEGSTNARSPFWVSRPQSPQEKQTDQDLLAGDDDAGSDVPDDDGSINVRSPFRVSRPQPPQEKQTDQDQPAGDDDTDDEEPKDEWNPFWGPRPSENQESDDSYAKERIEEFEKEKNASLVHSLKGGVASIGASSEFFMPFPTQKEIIEQVHKILKKLVDYRDNWTRGEVTAHQRSILQKEAMILIVSIDHFKKCRKTYLSSLDIILELLTNIERILSPSGAGVILPGTIDVYNQEVKSLFSVSESEKKVAIITKILGFFGFMMLVVGIFKPEFSAYRLDICGGMLLFASIVFQKAHIWKNYSTRP